MFLTADENAATSGTSDTDDTLSKLRGFKRKQKRCPAMDFSRMAWCFAIKCVADTSREHKIIHLGTKRKY